MYLKIVFLVLFATVTAASYAQSAADLQMLVAHRGVVNDTLSENSIAALEETIRRGYTHIEVDLRVTKDGHAVALHDRSLKRTTGLDKNIDEITLAELHELVSRDLVPSFEEFAATCAGRIELMPDVKTAPVDLADAFATSIHASMQRHNLLDQALFIGWPEVVDRFKGASKINLRKPYAIVQGMVDRKEIDPSHYFIFNHAADFDRNEVEGFHALGFPIVVSINTFHYRTGDPIQQGLDDVQHMLTLGVDGLQIDAVYDAPLIKL